MLNKRSKAEWFGDSINVLILGFLSLIMLYPMLYELFMSFSVASQVAKHRGVLLWPLGFTLTPYRLVFAEKTIISGYRNTFFVLSIGLVFNITFNPWVHISITKASPCCSKPVMIRS
jgi:putative aldouronate transport system permease protein